MDEQEYHTLYNQLDSLSAIDALVTKGYDKKLLFVIYTNRTIREVKKKYYSVKKKAPELVMDWRLGTTFLEISEKQKFPPVMTASLLMQQMGYNKKRVRQSMQEPGIIEDERIKNELLEVMRADKIYSPEGTRIQTERGRDVENFVDKWLTKENKKFMTEKQSKEEGYPKTPDFRLQAPIRVDGKWVNWIECKGTFGDKKEMQKDYKDQLTHYVDLFGAGMVVYWFGFLEGFLTDERILVRDKSFFK